MRLASLLVAASMLGLSSAVPHTPAAPRETALLLDSDSGRAIDALGPGDDVRVFVFIRRDCPIANRYAPELRRLRDTFAASNGSRRPVRLWLVYVDRDETAGAIAAHQREYALEYPWLIDRTHRLAALAGATVTPEAAVFSPSRDGQRQLLYRGRIDDRVAEIGRARPAATTHDLRDAIQAALEGRVPRAAGGPAVGCFIADAR